MSLNQGKKFLWKVKKSEVIREEKVEKTKGRKEVNAELLIVE